MYITTSRKASLSTKILAFNLATFLNSIYEHRGKKSIEDVINRAEELGFSRIIIVGETKGNPNKISVIDTRDGWRWLFPFIIFSVRTEYVKKKFEKINKEVEVEYESESAKKIGELFDIPNPSSDDTIKMAISDNLITFRYKDKKFELKIKKLVYLKDEKVK